MVREVYLRGSSVKVMFVAVGLYVDYLIPEARDGNLSLERELRVYEWLLTVLDKSSVESEFGLTTMALDEEYWGKLKAVLILYDQILQRRINEKKRSLAPKGSTESFEREREVVKTLLESTVFENTSSEKLSFPDEPKQIQKAKIGFDIS